MSRGVIWWAVVFWVGLTLLFAQIRWFGRVTLVDRVRPYVRGNHVTEGRSGGLSVESFRDILGPLAQQAGATLARLFGVTEELTIRLERIHADTSVQAFRLRQLGWSLAALAAALIVTYAVGLPTPIALLALSGSPLLAFLLIEQHLHSASAAWQRRLFLELPVISEQLGMLLSAGYSLSGACNRLATRGSGACSRDLARVCGRIRQGLSEVEGLREWAALARVDQLDRLVAVLALNREAGDLGRLVAEEARAIRREVHRHQIEIIERRAQQVWIPVTVATLVPGVLLLAVPFVEAMRLFTAT
ncbi:MAG: type II secretion system F family protein [Acidimicrobiales bacterium]|nr:type II secretion system F family protein [Acidimicrobiales bacterium]